MMHHLKTTVLSQYNLLAIIVRSGVLVLTDVFEQSNFEGASNIDTSMIGFELIKNID